MQPGRERDYLQSELMLGVNVKCVQFPFHPDYLWSSCINICPQAPGLMRVTSPAGEECVMAQVSVKWIRYPISLHWSRSVPTVTFHLDCPHQAPIFVPILAAVLPLIGQID